MALTAEEQKLLDDAKAAMKRNAELETQLAEAQAAAGEAVAAEPGLITATTKTTGKKGEEVTTLVALEPEPDKAKPDGE